MNQQENPFTTILQCALVLGIISLGLVVWASVNRSIDERIDKNAKKEIKTLIEKCKPLSYSVLASPNLSGHPLNLYQCKDGGIQYYYVSERKLNDPN